MAKGRLPITFCFYDAKVLLSLYKRFLNGLFQAKLQHLINVVHSVEKIEKIIFAEPGSTGMAIYMEENRLVDQKY